ncbi:hypothetical protein O1L60_08215 [Streptomyces diastatochromogenes]|nr:hypothetical protein [Streptomyces diastatochromogenes]
MLLAPYVRLDPYGMPLLVVEVIAVAVIARMRSLPVAVGAALAIGVAQAQLTRLHPEGWAGPLLRAVGANLFVVALLVAALVLPGVGGEGRDALPPPARATRVPAPLWPVVGVLFLLPWAWRAPTCTRRSRCPRSRWSSCPWSWWRAGAVRSRWARRRTRASAPCSRRSWRRRGPGPGRAGPRGAPGGRDRSGDGRPAIRRHGLALALATLAVGWR